MKLGFLLRKNKCISGNLNSISFIGFDFTKGLIIKVLKIIAMDKYQFYSLPIQSTVV